MAYIYRYQLRKRSQKLAVNLTHYSGEIENVLEVHFKENLKDCVVKETYFEFKLFVSVPVKMLQGMGRELHRRLSDDMGGFLRMKQKLYALVYQSQYKAESPTQGKMAYVEFIDAMLLDEQNEFSRRSHTFFQRHGRHEINWRAEFYENGVAENFYTDILTAHVDTSLYMDFLENENEISCFAVTGYHRRSVKIDEIFYDNENRNIIRLEASYDVEVLEHQQSIYNQTGDWGNYSDAFAIHSIKKRNDLADKIETALSLHLAQADEIYALNSMQSNQSYIFRVHDVGQALATSISYENGNPFLYFDYGMPYGRNAHTMPANMNMPTQQGCTIILSHLDMDHWRGIFNEYNAYMCHWFIPQQRTTALLKHKLAEIITFGGTVECIGKDITFPHGKLTCGGISRINPARIAAAVHETGLTLRIQAGISGEANQQSIVGETNQKCNILIPGDQEYDYIEMSQLADLDILVATHHGGRFSWSSKDTPPLARVGGKSTVIYSCGKDNTYGHPSKQDKYTQANWKNEHTTYVQGEYTCLLFL